MKRSNRKPLLLAALLASSPALNVTDDALSVRATFPDKATVTPEGHLLTDHQFRVEIDRVEFTAQNIDLQARDEEQLEQILLSHSFGPNQTELALRGARVHGRIFDDTGDGRLPEAGLGISGLLPVEVVVARSKTPEHPLSVRFEVPTFFFEGVDWSKPS